MARFSSTAYLKEWRERQVAISQHAIMARLFGQIAKRFEDEEDRKAWDDKTAKACEALIEEVSVSALQDDRAYTLNYLRNYTSAFYLATHQGQVDQQAIEDFDREFTYPTWVAADDLLHHLLGDDEYFKQVKAGQEMSRYVQLMVHVYMNRLMNLANGGDLGVVEDESLITELQELHQQFEDQKLFDEIAVIRYQIIHQVIGDNPDLLFDEAASRVFIVDAYDLLCEINTKPRQLEPVGGPHG